MRRFEDLEIFGRARDLSRTLYAVTRSASFARDPGLRGQLRRAGASVMANIAEGYERDGNREFLQFLAHAKGSCGEIRSHLYVAVDQQYLGTEAVEEILQAVICLSRMISNLMKHLRTSPLRGLKLRDGTPRHPA